MLLPWIFLEQEPGERSEEKFLSPRPAACCREARKLGTRRAAGRRLEALDEWGRGGVVPRRRPRVPPSSPSAVQRSCLSLGCPVTPKIEYWNIGFG